MTSIGDNAFFGCSALATVSISSSSKEVFTLGDNAFRGTAIRTIALPQKVGSIGNDAFADCPNLIGITLIGDAPEIGTGVLDNTTPMTFFHYPKSNDTYQVVDGLWNGYKATSDSMTDNFMQYTLSDVEGHTVIAALRYNGALSITGATASGEEIPDFESADAVPWAEFKPYINVVTMQRISRIGNYTFSGLEKIQTILFIADFMSGGSHINFLWLFQESGLFPGLEARRDGDSTAGSESHHREA